MLKNSRNEAGQVLCPICNAPLTDMREIAQAGQVAYHRACWRPTEYPGRGPG